ncbi:MAG TPA: dienelactone hydrolase family protein [Steroidobacter sp.]
MSKTVRAIAYEHDGERFDGALILPASATDTLPVVLVVPAWEGRSTAQEIIAEDLVRLGYAAFCVDVYGSGKRGTTPSECEALMAPLLADRDRLRARLLRAVDAAQACPEVDPKRTAAIGFCFGGLCVLDLARANAPVAAVASFHGLFTPLSAPSVATSPIGAKVIAFHGWDDPMVAPTDVTALGRELNAAKADWQIHVYGGTQHAFTNKDANSPQAGVQYNARAADRAWIALQAFLREVFEMQVAKP